MMGIINGIRLKLFPSPQSAPASRETAPKSTAEILVFIPGLWFPVLFLRPLARRLRSRGFIVYLFSYPSVREDLRANAARLARYLDTLEAVSVHLVGHSLGGILIRALFHFHPERKPGRIVTLGTPHGGCRVATHLSRHAFWRRALGKSVGDLLSGATRDWPTRARDIGVICGTSSMGLGRVVYRELPRPNDGLLTVKESAYPAAREHLALPVSHTGMLFSRAVADQVGAFLLNGRFDR